MGALYLLLNFAMSLMLLLKVKFIDFLKKGMRISLITQCRKESEESRPGC